MTDQSAATTDVGPSGPFWSSYLAMAITAVLAVVVSQIIYNLFFHPLRKVPGPWWYAATALPRCRIAFDGYSHRIIRDFHTQYGDIVRIGPNEVSITAPRAWTEVAGQKRLAGSAAGGAYVENPKDSVFYRYASQPNSILAMPQAEHVHARKSLNASFSAAAVAKQEGLVQRHVDQLMAILRNAAAARAKDQTTTVNMSAYLNWTLFDISGDLAVGEPFGSLRDHSEHAWVAMIPDSVRFATILVNLHRLLGHVVLVKLFALMLLPPILRKKRKWHIALSKDKVDRRRALGPGRPDLMTAMLNGDEFWTVPRIVQTSTTLISAASETSGTALGAVLFFLTAQPNAGQPGSALARLTAEVRNAFAHDSEICFDSVRNLPFLGAVLDEALRIHHPGPTGFPREARPGGVVIEGYYMPEGTVLGINHWAMYRSPRNFVAADEFHPERWLGEDPRFDADHKEAFMPFSYGPRNCIGRYLAVAEMRTILSRIVWNFDIALCSESRSWEIEQKSYSFWQKIPLHMILTERTDMAHEA